MNAPDPKANTTTEAYLAYKAGYLEESELKPVLYEPYLHFDAWLAYWAGLNNEYPLDKNGDPEMLTDEEALVAYLSGVTDTYPEEIKDPYDVRIVGYLKHLVSIRWPEPDYPVNNSEFYLSTMKPPVVPSGDPSSDIEMDDTAEAPFIDLKMYGDTYQQTYSGANIYNFRDTAAVSSQGVSVDDDGWITFTSDNTGGSSTLYTNYFSSPLQVVASTPYNVMLEIKSVNGTSGAKLHLTSYHSVSQFREDSEIVLSEIQPGITKYILTTATNISSCTVGLRTYLSCSAGDSGTVTFRLSVLEDTSITPEDFVYQPFTGNAPAPNPDYPQPIQVVTGEQKVNVRGVNMFNVNKPLENKYLDSSGVWVTSSYAYINQEYIVTGSSELSFSFAKRNGSALIRVGEFKADGTFIKRTLVSTVSTLTLDALTNKIIFSVDNLSPNYFDKLQIELGSSPTSYHPYTSQTYEINLGKNLLDVTTFEDGYINSSGTVSGGGGTNAVFGFMPVLPGTDYTVSVQKNSFAMSIAYYDSSKTLISRVTNDYVGRTSRTFTTPQNCAYARAGFYAGSGASQSVMESSLPQFELGSNATTYSPYFVPIELCKLSSVSDAPEVLVYQDYIYESEEGWMLHKEIDKAIFDGSSDEDWKAHNQHNGIYAWDWLEVGAAHSNSAILSDLYRPVYITTYNSDSGRGYGMIATLEKTTTSERETVFMTAPNSSITTLVQFRGWLAENPVTAYFASANPTDTLITNNELIAQLDALKEGGSYTGKTYITVTSTAPNLPALLKVEAGEYR